MSIFIIILGAGAIGYFLLWNIFLLGYRDRHTQPIKPAPEHCFCPEAKPIVLVHDPDTDRGRTEGRRNGRSAETRSGRAVLMVHGFPSSPRIYSYAAPRMFDAGYDVFVPLLPGFGTDPKVFEQTTFTQWYEYLASYYRDLRTKYRFLVVIGTSMGGAMTLKIGEQFSGTPEEPDGIVAIAAPVVYNSLFRDGLVTDWRMYLMRTVGLFTPAIGAGTKCGDPNGEDGSEDWTGYRGLFIRQGLSLVSALKTIRKELPTITCPLFSIHDRNDKTVPFKNQSIIERETNSRNWRKLETKMGPYRHTHHALLMYHSIQKDLTDTIIAHMDGMHG